MPVKHALLALLAERDLTGYELKIRFERALGDFWQLNSGQVYSTLERLRQSGMVARRPDGAVTPAAPRSTTATACERTRYTLLPRGRRELEQWMSTPVPRLRPIRDPLYVKLVFSTQERAPALLLALAAEARRYVEAAETLGALVAREPLSHSGRVRWLVAEAARSTYEAQVRWLETVRRVLAPPRPLQAPRVTRSAASEAPSPQPVRVLSRRAE